MKKKPVVAVVGRPNVGKSTLFNVLAGDMISIVKDTPGVTRDRIYADCTWLDHSFTLIDTGGIEPDTKDIILSQMREQAEIAIATADVILFIVDVRQGMTDSDSKVADMLRKSRKPVVLAVNKVDNPAKFGNDVYEFYNLGLGEPYGISALHGYGVGELLDAAYEYFPPADEEEEDADRIRVALIGKPNVGKSSLLNRVLGEERVIVSNIAGTTRDSVDADVDNAHGKFTFIDTAGIRKKSKVDEKIEKYIIDIIFATREPAEYNLEKLQPLIAYGGSPRASISLAKAARAYAFIRRRGYVIPEDVRAVCHDVLRHRIGLTYEAEAENISTEQIITDILNNVIVP